jgi:hypothetical protein
MARAEAMNNDTDPFDLDADGAPFVLAGSLRLGDAAPA